MCKNIILLITISSLNTIIGMEPQLSPFLSNPKLSEFLSQAPSDITTQIYNYAKPRQCWYLEQTFDHSTSIDDNHIYKNFVHSVCFHPSSKYLATTSTGNEIPIFDIQKNQKLYCPKKIYRFPNRGIYGSVCFNSSGKALAALSSQDNVQVFDIQTNTIISSFQEHGNSFAYFDSSGRLLAKYPNEKQVCIFDIQKNEKIRSFQYNNKIWAICFGSSGKLFATTTYDYHDSKIYIHDIRKNKIIKVFKHHGCIRSMEFNPSETLLAIRLNGKLNIVNIEKNKIIKSFPYDNVSAFNFSSSGEQLAIASNNTVYICDTYTQKEISFFNHNGYINKIIFDRSGKRLATASDSNARLFLQYDGYTINQVLLKKALLAWLLIEKPDKNINSLENFLKDVALKCDIPHATLVSIWQTFPENMQSALWRTMLYKIRKYGKYPTTTCSIQ